MGAVYPAGAVRIQGETLSLSTTLASLGGPRNAYQLTLYDPDVDFRLHLNPSILAIAYYDATNSAGARFEHGSGTGDSLIADLTDRDTSTGTGTAMDSGTTADFLYICTSDVVSGFRITIGSANDNTATIVATYRKNDDTWASLTETDGTASGGDTLAQTGSITWTAPTDAKRAPLGGGSGIVTDADAPGVEGFWWRLAWDAALDSDTEIDEIWTLNKNTTRGYFRAGREYEISLDRRNVGAIEAILAAGTDTLEATWVVASGV